MKKALTVKIIGDIFYASPLEHPEIIDRRINESKDDFPQAYIQARFLNQPERLREFDASFIEVANPKELVKHFSVLPSSKSLANEIKGLNENLYAAPEGMLLNVQNFCQSSPCTNPACGNGCLQSLDKVFVSFIPVSKVTSEKVDQLTIDEALLQGYDRFIFNEDGFQCPGYIKDVTEQELAREDIRLLAKESYNPGGISSKDIAALLAEHIYCNHADDTGDDTDRVYDAIKALDFSEAEQKISEALSNLHYFRGTNIKLIANP